MSRDFGAKKEAVYGEAYGATTTYIASMISETIQKNQAWEDLAPVRAQTIQAANLLTESQGGDVECLGSYNENWGIFFLAFLGSAEAVTGADPYTHLFPDAANGVLSRLGMSLGLDVRRDSDTLRQQYLGAKVVGMRYSASLSQSPQLGFSFVAKDSALSTPIIPSSIPFEPMTIGDTTLSIDGGVTDAKVQSININAAWPVDEPYAMGDSKFAVEPIDNDFLTVEGEATIILEDLVEFDKMDGTTAIDVEVQTTNGVDTLQFDMKNSRYTSYAWNVSGKDRLLANIAWKSIFNATADGNLLITLINSDATDYGAL